MRLTFFALLIFVLASCEKPSTFSSAQEFSEDTDINNFLEILSDLTMADEAKVESLHELIKTAGKIESKFGTNNQELTNYLELEIAKIIEDRASIHTQRELRSFVTRDTLQFGEEEVWDVLIDIENYPVWNPFTVAVQTTFEVGSPIIMDVRLLPFLTIKQPETISLFDPFNDMCWSSFIISESIFSTYRCRSLESISDNSIIYSNTMVYDGLIAPLVNAITRPLVFHGFVQESKALSNYLENK